MSGRSVKACGWLLVCGLYIAACGDDSPDRSGTGEMQGPAAAADAGSDASTTAEPVQESDAGSTTRADLTAFEATGLNRYLGKAKPAEMIAEGNETQYLFNEADGPACIRGGRYGMSTRDRGSDDLVIYLQGGGSCTTALCRATEMASPKMPARGLLNPSDPANPVAGWNVVYSPYCDGSLHFGDADIPDQNRKHRGLRNVSAALDVARSKFPKPHRVLLTGASAGGYGTIWMTSLVRLIYPDAKLFVFNDAGIAISNPASPDGFRSVLGEWGATQFIPATCDACKTGPHLARWMSWNLRTDPQLKLAMFSSYEDSVIAGTFLMLDPAIFKQALLDETAAVVEADPARAKRFLIAGTQHTVGDIHRTAVGELSIAEWLRRMLEGDASWDNVVQ